MAAVLSLAIFLVLLLMVTSGIRSEDDMNTVEVCSGEEFEPNCGPSDVIIIHAADYGRSEVGKCIPVEQDYMGCNNDVLPLVEKWCSGRRDCSPLVPNPELDAANKHCLEYVRMYLNITYRCVTAAPLAPEVCHNATSLNLSGREGYIPSLLAHETGCVSKTSPAIIQGEKGQKIQFTLHDFSMKESRETVVYGNILDRSTNVSKTIYGGSTRTTEVYTSGSHIAEVVLFHEEKSWMEVDPFVLQYRVIGCPEPVVPSNAWYLRDGDDVEIGCNRGDDRWSLICRGDIWHGKFGNCTAKVAGSKFLDMDFWFSPIFLTTAVTSVVVLAVVLLVVGCICYRRRKFKGDQGQGVEVILEVPNSPMPVRIDSRKPSQCTIDEDDELTYSVHVRKMNKPNLREKPLPALPGETTGEIEPIIPGMVDLCVESRLKQNGVVPRAPEKFILQNADFQRPRLPDPSPPELPVFDPPMEYEIVQVRSSGDFTNTLPVSEHTSATNPDTELLLPTRRRTSSVSSASSSASDDSVVDQRDSPSTQESNCARSADSENIIETPDQVPGDRSSFPTAPPPPYPALEGLPMYAEHTKPRTATKKKADPPPPVARSASENDSLLDDSDSAPVPDLPRKSWLFEEPPESPIEPTGDADTLDGLTAEETLESNQEPLINVEVTSPVVSGLIGGCQNGECHYTNCEC